MYNNPNNIVTIILIVVSVTLAAAFEPDTTIKAGDLFVPVSMSVKEENKYREVTYTDSLGRIVFFHSYGGGSKGGTSTSRGLEFNSDSMVKKSYYDSNSSGPGYVRHTKSSITGTTWNDQGMITRGVYYKWYRDGGTYSSESYSVEIIYDESGLVKIETIIDSTTIKSFNMTGYYTAGEKMLPVMNMADSSKHEDSVFVDMQWRTVYYSMHTGGPKGAVSHTKGLYVTNDNMVKFSYSDSLNNGPGYVRHTKDTLWGEEWNNKGMVTKGHFYQWYRDGGLYTITEYDGEVLYDETGVIPVDTIIDSATISIFKPTRLYTAGALTLGVVEVALDTLPEGAVCFIDQWGRALYKKYGEGGQKGGWSIEEKLELTSDNKVEFSIYEHNKSTGGHSFNQLDSLIGHTWNEKGMITTGLMHRIIEEYGVVTDTAFMVSILYNEAGVIPTEIIYEKVTDIVGTQGNTSLQPSVTFQNGLFTLTGLKEQTAVAILDVKGRVLTKTTVQVADAFYLSTDRFASGVYFLQVGTKIMKFVK